MKKKILLFVFLILITSCQLPISVSNEIGANVVFYAYRYTLADSIKYDLLFYDANVKSLFNYYTVFIDSPSEGDIIFIGEEDNKDIPARIGTYVKSLDNNIYLCGGFNTPTLCVGVVDFCYFRLYKRIKT